MSKYYLLLTIIKTFLHFVIRNDSNNNNYHLTAFIQNDPGETVPDKNIHFVHSHPISSTELSLSPIVFVEPDNVFLQFF